MEVEIDDKNLIMFYEKGSNSKYQFVDKKSYKTILCCCEKNIKMT